MIKNLPGGKVEIDYDDGAHYVGEYKDGTLTGLGTMHYSDGRIYKGRFKNGEWHGYGTATFPGNNGPSEIYEGHWLHNHREGTGKTTYYNEDGSFKSLVSARFHNDMIDGTASILFANGDQLDGTLKEYVPAGPVVYRYGLKRENPDPAGWTYEGEMPIINNTYMRQGHGKMTAPDGTVYEGEFKNDMWEGRFIITYPDGRKEEAQYANGEKIGMVPDRTAERKHDDSGSAAVRSRNTGARDTGKKNKNNAAADPDTETAADVFKGWQPDPDDESFLRVQYKGNDKYSAELKPYFDGVIGMEAVKDQLDKMYKRFRIDAMRRKAMGISQGKQGFYFIITGNPGTGKTTVARIIGRMLHDMGFLSGDVYVEVDRGRLVGQYIGQTAKQTASVIESARGGTLFIDEAYTLFKKDDEKDFGTEAIDTLLKDMEDHRGEYCCILAGYQDRMDEMIRFANPGLASRFDHKIHIGDYSPDEIADILVSMAAAKHFYIKSEARQIILARTDKEKVDETFDNARFARRLLDEAIEHQALRLSENMDSIEMEDLQILEAEDFGRLTNELSTLDSCLKELNALTGLAAVKDEVNGFVNAVRIRNESRKRGLAIAANPVSLNMIFTGNPGTGKTTVARLLNRIYYHLGLLKRPDVFVECVRADLVGRYQGETAIKVKEAVRSALGGILFIDEAYSLVMGDGDTFGIEAVNTLVSEIENNRENLAVVMAGYTDEMQKFLDSNPGLRSRLPRVLEFPDYTLEELVQIFNRELEKRGYEAEMSEPVLRALIGREMGRKDFGNARGVRNLVDTVIGNHNERMTRTDLADLSNDDILSITDEDA